MGIVEFWIVFFKWWFDLVLIGGYLFINFVGFLGVGDCFFGWGRNILGLVLFFCGVNGKIV